MSFSSDFKKILLFFLFYATFKNWLQMVDSLYYSSVSVNQTYVRVGWILLKISKLTKFTLKELI